MDLVFTLIVLCTAIIGMFSQEFMNMFKRIFSIRGAPLILPLFLISLLIESHLVWGWQGLAMLRSGLFFCESKLAMLMPQQAATDFFVRVLILTLLAVIPIVLVGYCSRKNKMSTAMFYTYRISAIIWLIATILFVSVVP